MIKVGINGFGRIGRFVFRAAQKRNDIQIVGINDLCPVDYLAYMLKYDTMHGQFDGTIEADVENSKLIVNGNAIRVTAERNPADLKWDAIGAENYAKYNDIYVTPFNDVTENKGYIALLSAMGVLSGDGNGNFNPNREMTRAESIIMIYNYLTR